MQGLINIFMGLPALSVLFAALIVCALALGLSFARGRKALTVAIYLAIVLHLVVFLHASLSYVRYPFEGKSVVEGAVLFNAVGYMHGQHSYRAPTELPLTSQVYPPVHEMALAAFMFLTGPSLYAARLFSLLAALAASILAGYVVWRHTRNALAAALGGGFFIFCYGLSGYWHEQVRNDSLMALWCVLGLLLVERSAERGRFPLAGLIVLLLAVFTKQVALFAPAATAALLALRSQRLAVRWVAAFVVTAAVVFGAMQLWTDGWFSFYILRVPFGVGADMAKYTLAGTFLETLWIALLAAALIAAPALRPSADAPWRLWAWAFAFALPLSILQSFKWGALSNAFIPVLPIMGILAGIALHEFMKRDAPRTWIPAMALLLALLQVSFTAYRPALPSQADYRAQQRISGWVKVAPGDAFVSVFSSQVYLNGKTYFGDDVTIGDMKRAGVWSDSALLEKTRRRGFGVMVLRPDLAPPEFAEAVAQNYVRVEQVRTRSDLCAWAGVDIYAPRDPSDRPTAK